MVRESQKQATERYRKKNVTTFTVKFFPADAEILEYFQGKENSFGAVSI